ncbi:MAG: hypothetical protein Q7S12_00635 [bacterium]|nr:hypothetical protein [bacterium]
MKGQKLKILFLVLVLIFVLTNTALAGFGISPAQIQADRLAPGTHYEENFILSRGQPTEDLIAKVSFDFPNDPEVVNWISVEPDTTISLPKGEQRVPLIVKIDVPNNAEYKDYSGFMRLGVAPTEAVQKQGVAISLGAKVSIDLKVTKIKIIEFKVRNLRIPSSEEGIHFWKIFFPGKINLVMNVENTGNVKAAPLKAEIEIYNLTQKNLLFKGEDKTLSELKPFEKKDVKAGFRHKLKPGQYWSTVRVYSDKDKVAIEDKMILTITEMEISNREWLILGGGILGIFVFILALIFIILKLKKRIKNIFKK